MESESYAWAPGSRREYHVISRGLIANEVVRRVDPRGRTVGQILRYHISEPLGADAFIGLNEDGEYVESVGDRDKVTSNIWAEVKRSFSVEFLHPLRFMLKNMFSRQPKSVSILSLLSLSLGMLIKGETGVPVPT